MRGGLDLNVGDHFDFLLAIGGGGGLVGESSGSMHTLSAEAGLELSIHPDSDDGGTRLVTSNLFHGLLVVLDGEELPVARLTQIVALLGLESLGGFANGLGLIADGFQFLALVEGLHAADGVDLLVDDIDGFELNEALAELHGAAGEVFLADIPDQTVVVEFLVVEGQAKFLLHVLVVDKAEGERDFPGLGGLRVEQDLGRAQPEGGRKDEGVDKADGPLLHDLLDVGVKVGVLGIGLGTELSVDFQRLADLHFGLLQGFAGEDGLEVGGPADGLDLGQVLPDGEGPDESVDPFDFLLDFVGDLDIQRELSVLPGGLDFDGGGSVDGHFGTSTDQLLVEGRDDTNVVVHLNVDDGDDLSPDIPGNVQVLDFFSGHFEFTLESGSNGKGPFDVNGETSVTGAESLNVEGLVGQSEGELPALFHGLLVAQGFGDLVDDFAQLFLAEEGFEFVIEETHLGESFGNVLGHPFLDVQLGDDLGEFILDLAARVGSFLVVEQDLVDQLVHALSVDGPFGSVELEAVAEDLGDPGVPDGSVGSVVGLDVGPLLANNEVQVFNPSGLIEVLGVLVTEFEGLDQSEQRPDLLAFKLEFGDFGTGQSLEGGVDEGSNLLGGFEPGPDGDLLEFRSVGLSPGQNLDGGNPDFGGFSNVINDGQQDGLDKDGVELSGLLEAVDSDGPNHGAVLLVGDDLAHDPGDLDVAELAEGSNDVKLDAPVLDLFKFLFHEADVFFDDLGFLVTEGTVDPDGELVVLQGGDASLVEQPGHLEHANVEQLGPFVGPLPQVILDQLNQFSQDFPGGGLDAGHDVLQHLVGQDGVRLVHFPNLFLDKQNGGVGTDQGQSVVEDVFEGFLHFFAALLADQRPNPGFDLLEFREGQSPQSLGDDLDVSGDVSSFGTALGAIEKLIGELLHDLFDLPHEFLGLDLDGDQHLGGRSEVRLGHDGTDAGFLFNGVPFLFRKAVGHVAPVLGGEFEDERLEFLGVAGFGDGGRDGSFLDKFKNELGLVLEFLFGPPAGGGPDNVLGDGLPDLEVTGIVTADNVGGGGDVVHEVLAGRLGQIALSLDSAEELEEGPLSLAVVEVLGLGDLEVVLATANLSSLGKTTGKVFPFVPLLFVLFHLLFNFQSLVLGDGVEGVGSLTIAMDGLFTNGEVGLFKEGLLEVLFLRNLKTVGVDLVTPGSAQVHVQVSQKGLLDVDDMNGFVGIDEESFDETAPHVSLERLDEVGLEGLRDGLLLLFLSLDTINGHETRLFELDHQAVVGLGLDTDEGHHTKAGLLGLPDFGDLGVNERLVTENQFLGRFPAITVSGVAEGSSN